MPSIHATATATAPPPEIATVIEVHLAFKQAIEGVEMVNGDDLSCSSIDKPQPPQQARSLGGGGGQRDDREARWRRTPPF